MSLVAGLGGAAPSAAAPTRRARGGAYLLLAPGMAYLGLFFVVPTLALLATSLYVPVPGGDVGQFQPAFEWANYTRALADYWPQMLRSFVYASIATVAALAIGYPMAYVIAVRARGRPFLQGTLLVLVIAPFFTSFILRTIAWKQILADESLVVALLRAVSVLPPDGRLTATGFAVVCGLTYNFLPFMTLPLYASLERIDVRLIEAATDLYSSAWTAFRKVTFPLSLPGVVAGTLLTFIPAAGDPVNAFLLGSSNDQLMGNAIDSQFKSTGNYPLAAALSAMLMVVIVAMVALYVRRAGTEELV